MKNAVWDWERDYVISMHRDMGIPWEAFWRAHVNVLQGTSPFDLADLESAIRSTMILEESICVSFGSS